jgi:hypothetical protein
MARLVFGIPYREVAKQLRARNCEVVRRSTNGREVWVTPRGFMFPMPSNRKDIAHSDAMRMNQALRKEDIEEIRPHSRKGKPAKARREKDKQADRMRREEAREEKRQMQPLSLVPPPPPEPPPPPKPTTLFGAFKQRYFSVRG